MLDNVLFTALVIKVRIVFKLTLDFVPPDMHSHNDQHVDPSFSALPSSLKQRIDKALDKVVSRDIANNSERPLRWKRQTSDELSMAIEPGGFIVEEQDHGFDLTPPSMDDPMRDRAEPYTAIPFRLIPQALQLLDLQPDDEDVLEVFKNAASGWENTTGVHRIDEDHDDNLVVSRRDWRAVCAALLDNHASHVDDEDVDADADERMGDVQEDAESDLSDLSEEEYVDSAAEDDADDDSGDEYQEGGFVRSKPRAKVGTRGRSNSQPKAGRSRNTPHIISSDDDTEPTGRVTARQKAECRRTFALFFPGVSDLELDHKRIMIRDVARVAGMLNEKISTEEVRSNGLLS